MIVRLTISTALIFSDKLYTRFSFSVFGHLARSNERPQSMA